MRSWRLMSGISSLILYALFCTAFVRPRKGTSCRPAKMENILHSQGGDLYDVLELCKIREMELCCVIPFHFPLLVNTACAFT